MFGSRDCAASDLVAKGKTNLIIENSSSDSVSRNRSRSPFDIALQNFKVQKRRTKKCENEVFAIKSTQSPTKSCGGFDFLLRISRGKAAGS